MITDRACSAPSSSRSTRQYNCNECRQGAASSAAPFFAGVARPQTLTPDVAAPPASPAPSLVEAGCPSQVGRESGAVCTGYHFVDSRSSATLRYPHVLSAVYRKDALLAQADREPQRRSRCDPSFDPRRAHVGLWPHGSMSPAIEPRRRGRGLSRKVWRVLAAVKG